VDDVTVRKPVRASYDCLAGFYGAERPGFLGESRSGGAVDGNRCPEASRRIQERPEDEGDRTTCIRRSLLTPANESRMVSKQPVSTMTL
jgi:hypothetical protein